ncbi:uracil-DNA glycosylase family protein [Segetibacter sp. 3557_3]|uniref:uracil-DNA glycosylase family protein n=1 Tax=Segetibacter sp. 3557_3 TaxID=2547429 RepID=UPI001405400E|nr:uracil-DNA glycosylase family protein [Segetibacter sp. 3557_3]
MDIYQGPALERAKEAQIFWVGLSAVMFKEGQEKLPLSPLKSSGALIHSIEAPLRPIFSFYKTNLVKCAPIEDDKVRYPLTHEMEKCFPNFEWELKHLHPKVVLLLGKQVADFVLKRFDLPKVTLAEHFQYHMFLIDGTYFVPVHHPSYMLIYKRRYIQQYINGIQDLISKSICPKKGQ